MLRLSMRQERVGVMKSRILPSHPRFPLKGHSHAIEACWDFELGKGESLALHKHLDVEEVYIVLSGEGFMTVGQTTSKVRTGDVIYIPPEELHSIYNLCDASLRCLTIVARIQPVSLKWVYCKN